MDDLDPAELEEMLLEGPRLYRRSQVARYADSQLDQLSRLWRALGFPDVPEGSVAFTDADLVALRRVLRMADGGVFDEEFVIGATRAMGYHLARLVEWQYVALAERVARDGGDAEDAGPAGLALLTENLVDFEALLLYVWRRQLVATAGRVLAGGDAEVARRRRTVGFADLVSYTELAQRLEARELAALVDRFEALSADIIAEHGGRLVKTVGDEVLFILPTARAAARTALALAEGLAADELVPDVRVGLATGLVLTRLGDVFGTVVNLASRLTALARPGTVLVDAATAERLATDQTFVLREQGPRLVRGLGQVVPWELTRRDEARGAAG